MRFYRIDIFFKKARTEDPFDRPNVFSNFRQKRLERSLSYDRIKLTMARVKISRIWNTLIFENLGAHDTSINYDKSFMLYVLVHRTTFSWFEEMYRELLYNY